MKNPLRSKLTYANVIATIALFLALGGGAWAATTLPKNSIGSTQLRNGAVTGEKIRSGSLIASDFAEGELPAGTPGPTGQQGEDGPRGLRGFPGEEGATGADGEQGLQGEQGNTGARGARGEQGEPGERGATGAQGTQGETGERGARGERGAQGPEGEPGERGARGARGEAGASGTTEIVTRYGPEVMPGKFPETSYAACEEGETVSGGGFDLSGRVPSDAIYQVQANRPSLIAEEEEEEVFYPQPKNGNAATGWAVTIANTAGTELRFRAYAMCATPAEGGTQQLSQANQEGQQVLQLLH
jgi:Collagen triple helix repeat (20 copies)